MTPIPKTLYHVTPDLSHDGVFTTRVPANRMDGEDDVTPRICVAASLGGSLTSAPFGSLYLDETLEETDGLLKVFAFDLDACGLTENDVITPRDLYKHYNVHDALITNEYWLLHDVVVPKDKQRIVRITAHDYFDDAFILSFDERAELLNSDCDVSAKNDVEIFAAYQQLYEKYPPSYRTITNVEFVDVTDTQHLLGGNLHEQRHPAL